MLTPEYLDQITDDILGMYDALNESVIEDIARRIVKTGRVTETAAWQAKQAQEMGALYEDVIRRVSEISGLTEQELQRLFEDAAVENIRYENDIMSQMGLMPIELKQSEAMLKLLRAGLDKTGRDLSNLTLTTAIRAQNAYYNASNLAYLQVSSGVLSHQEAVKKAILSTAREGVTVLYPTGHIDKIDVAIRRAVLTGVNQTAAKMSLEYCDETGCDFVETTAHSGARPSHAVWQGRVFCRSGTSSEYPPFSETGYGTGPGLCGWNCRHNFHAFWPGISVPAYSQEILDDYNAKKFEYNGEKLTDYECSQMQRAQERKIRETRRQLTACDAAMKATDDADLRDKLRMEFEGQSVRLKRQEAELRNFCEKTERAVDSARLQVQAVKDTDGRIIGFNKSVSQKAVHAKKSYDKKQDFSQLLSNLTDEERSVIKEYSGNLAQRVNALLYTGKTLGRYQAKVDLLDSALNKGAIKESITVIRKTLPEFLEPFREKRTISDADMTTLIGKIVTNSGYTSTSLVDFNYPGRNVIINMQIPEGYRGGLYIRPIAYEKYKVQEELLFKRELKYRIISVTIKEGKYYLDAEVLL